MYSSIRKYRAARASFAKAQEHFELALHLANWDFEGWFNSFKFDHDSAFQPSRQLVDSNFGGYSFDLVFRYEYVGAELWQHGGVKVGPCKKCVVALIAALMAALIHWEAEGRDLGGSSSTTYCDLGERITPTS